MMLACDGLTNDPIISGQDLSCDCSALTQRTLTADLPSLLLWWTVGGGFLVCRERDLTVANILSPHSVLMSPPDSYSPRNPTAPFRSLPRVLQQRESACFCLPGWLRCQLSSHWWVSHGPAISSSSLCLCAHSLFWLPHHPLSSIYQGTEKSMSAQSTFLDSLLLYH